MDITTIITRVEKTQHGFDDIRRTADEIVETCSARDAVMLGRRLFVSDVHQARMTAVFVFGAHAARSKVMLALLREQVSADTDWRVQECLAQAFDRVCKDTAYEAALPLMRDWLHDKRANVRRAVTEGLRIWTARPYFKQHPDAAIGLLAPLRVDDSDYVRRSAGNALRDISRKQPG